MQQVTNTGSLIALAGVVVSILAHFNIIVGQDSVVAILAGAVALYGVVHQLVVHRQVAKANGGQ